MTKILIVEDEFLVARHWQLHLASLGYDVGRPVTHGDKAVEAARAFMPDVIILDIRLAGRVDGLEAARQIRAFSSAALIFATGCAERALRDRAMELNPVAFLVKPLEAEEMEQAVRAAEVWLGQRGEAESAARSDFIGAGDPVPPEQAL
jgi:DNA-binding response OmpR family regulator